MADWRDVYQPRIFVRVIVAFLAHAIGAIVLFGLLAFILQSEIAGLVGFAIAAISWIRMNVQILLGKRNWITRPLHDAAREENAQ